MEKLDSIYDYDKVRIIFKKTKEELRSLISKTHQKELGRNSAPKKRKMKVFERPAEMPRALP